MSSHDNAAKTSQPIGLCVIGLGGFGQFALQQLVQVAGVKLCSIAGTTRAEAHHAAERYGATVCDSIESALANPEVTWVYINTPPFLHAEQIEAALDAGKHVLVEKPMTTDLHAAEMLLAKARSKQLSLVTNLMQRYNPVADAVRAIVAESLLGDPLYFSLSNHAVDEGLHRDHWFWDREKSGGIFVEHGVHFFDLAAYWFGDPDVVSAGRHCRSIDGREDQVWCDVQFRNESRDPVLGRFYHGFNQSSRSEAQSWEIQFERGRIEMSGWIPLHIELSGVVDAATTRRLGEILTNGRLWVLETYPPDRQNFRGHGRELTGSQRIRIRFEPTEDKQSLYGDLLFCLANEQLCQSEENRDKDRAKKLNPAAGLEALAVATRARSLAEQSTP